MVVVPKHAGSDERAERVVERAGWTDPERFDPERFDPKRGEEARNRGAFLPFGAGAHACIGARLSTLEAIVFWHTMLRRCRLAKPYRGHHTYTPVGVVNGDVELVVEPVSAAR